MERVTALNGITYTQSHKYTPTQLHIFALLFLLRLPCSNVYCTVSLFAISCEYKFFFTHSRMLPLLIVICSILAHLHYKFRHEMG